MIKLVDRLPIHTNPKIGVVVPVYGEDDSVCWLLGRFAKGLVNTICLVIDVPLVRGMEKIREAARQSGMTVHIIKNDHRTGVGHSLRQGLSYLCVTRHDIVVIAAGNGKDDPAEIKRLIMPIVRGECDYVQGSRYLPGGRSVRMPILRSIFSRLYAFVWSVLTLRKLTDVTNGFRCYTLHTLEDDRIDLFQNWLDGYSLEYYLHYKVLQLDYRVQEVPVSKIYPFSHKGGYSKVQPFKDWWPIVSPLLFLSLGLRN